MRKFIPKSKVSACLLAADFPSENPRTQNRTILIHKRWHSLTNELKIEKLNYE